MPPFVWCLVIYQAEIINVGADKINQEISAPSLSADGEINVRLQPAKMGQCRLGARSKFQKRRGSHAFIQAGALVNQNAYELASH